MPNDRCAAAPCAADSPLSASNRPPSATRGRHQAANRSSGATARAVTISARSIRGRPRTGASSSARARTTVVRSRSSADTAASRNTVRRASGSTRTTSTSGRATASTMPGSPAPEPTSTTRAPEGTSSATAAQLSRWRSQMRGASRGPIRPRVTPSVTSSLAYAIASVRRSPNNRSAATRSLGGGPCSSSDPSPGDRSASDPSLGDRSARERDTGEGVGPPLREGSAAGRRSEDEPVARERPVIRGRSEADRAGRSERSESPVIATGHLLRELPALDRTHRRLAMHLMACYGFRTARSHSPDDDAATRLDALRLALHAGHRVDDVVHALALERAHRLEAYRLAMLLHLFGRVLRDRDQLLATGRSEATDVEQQPRRFPRLPVDGEPGQLLQCLGRLTADTDQVVQAGADDLDHRPAVLHQLVDVAVDVENVEQPLDVVGRDLTLAKQIGVAVAAGATAWLFALLRLVLLRLVFARLVVGFVIRHIVESADRLVGLLLLVVVILFFGFVVLVQVVVDVGHQLVVAIVRTLRWGARCVGHGCLSEARGATRAP